MSVAQRAMPTASADSSVRDDRPPGRLRQIGQHLVVGDLDGVGAHVGHRAQKVHRVHRFDFQVVGVEDHPFDAAIDGDRQHQDRGLRTGGHRAGFAADDEGVVLPGRGQAGLQCAGRDELPGGQLVEQLGVGIVGRDQGAGDRRRSRTVPAPRRSRTRRSRSPAPAGRNPDRRPTRRGAGRAAPARPRPSSTAAGWAPASPGPRAGRPPARPGRPGISPSPRGRCAQV